MPNRLGIGGFFGVCLICAFPVDRMQGSVHTAETMGTASEGPSGWIQRQRHRIHWEETESKKKKEGR